MNSGMTYEELYKNILNQLFNSNSGGHLELDRVKGDSGEIALRVGTSEIPFGLINVGDAKSTYRSHLQCCQAGRTEYIV
jgi:hypothetical protein